MAWRADTNFASSSGRAAETRRETAAISGQRAFPMALVLYLFTRGLGMGFSLRTHAEESVQSRFRHGVAVRGCLESGDIDPVSLLIILIHVAIRRLRSIRAVGGSEDGLVVRWSQGHVCSVLAETGHHFFC